MNIRKAFLPLLLLLTPVAAEAALVGQLNKSLNLMPAMSRDYTDGFWMAGIEYQAWSLYDTKNGSELLYVAPQYLHGIEGHNQSASVILGVPVGSALISGLNGILQGLTTAAPEINIPGWLSNLSNYTSIEVGGGYNFMPMYSYIKPWFATIGATVKIPIGSGAKL